MLENTPTYYLVGSQAQADTVQARITEANAIRVELGEAPLAAETLHFASAEDEAFFLAALREADTVRGGLGLSGVTVVDLRTPAATATTVDPLTRELDTLTAANAVTTQGGMAELYGQQQADRIAEAQTSALSSADAPAAASAPARYNRLEAETLRQEVAGEGTGFTCEAGLGAGASDVGAC